MKLDFGFVSICLSEKECSPAGNVTVKQVQRARSHGSAGTGFSAPPRGIWKTPSGSCGFSAPMISASTGSPPT